MTRQRRSRADDPPPLCSRGAGAWKMLLGHCFSDLLDFFFPALGCDIQRGRYDFLDSDLQSLSRGIGMGRRIADRLIRVYLRDDTEMWFLVHVEIQGKSDVHFEERMFTYWYRAYDRHHREVVSLGVLADDEAGVLRDETPWLRASLPVSVSEASGLS